MYQLYINYFSINIQNMCGSDIQIPNPGLEPLGHATNYLLQPICTKFKLKLNFTHNSFEHVKNLV